MVAYLPRVGERVRVERKFLLLFAANFTSLLLQTPTQEAEKNDCMSKSEGRISQVSIISSSCSISHEIKRSFPLFICHPFTQPMNEHHSFQPLIFWKCNFRQYPNIFNNPKSSSVERVYIFTSHWMTHAGGWWGNKTASTLNHTHNRHNFPQVTVI